MGSSAAVRLPQSLADYYGVTLTQEVLHSYHPRAPVFDTLMTSTTQPVLYRKAHYAPNVFRGHLVIADMARPQTKRAVAQPSSRMTDLIRPKNYGGHWECTKPPTGHK